MSGKFAPKRTGMTKTGLALGRPLAFSSPLRFDVVIAVLPEIRQGVFTAMWALTPSSRTPADFGRAE
jgi:hypothetical protein